MAKIKKPILAATLESLDDLRFPIFCTEKLDGVRCLIQDNKALSRSFKQIPNKYIQNYLSQHMELNGCDGELLIKNRSFSEGTGDIMRIEGEPDFVYKIFDYVKTDVKREYKDRINDLISLKIPDRCERVIPTNINTKNEFLSFEEKVLSAGQEGVIARIPSAPYKEGRSTIKEFYLVKYKQFMDGEAKVLSLVEKEHNTNSAEKDNFGRTKRSSAKDGMVGAGTLGALEVEDIKTGIKFSLGSGFNDEQRQEIWNNPSKYIGALAKFRAQIVGSKTAPRFPTWIGWRSTIDL